jgi:hypothetical protein
MEFEIGDAVKNKFDLAWVDMISEDKTEIGLYFHNGRKECWFPISEFTLVQKYHDLPLELQSILYLELTNSPHKCGKQT